MTDSKQQREHLSPVALELVDFIGAYQLEHSGSGPTRQEIADHFNYRSTRSIRGVREAIDAGVIWYDGTSESRLVLRDEE